MKILIVINDYLNKSNGMCISTQRFVEQFRAAGHEVRIATNNRYGALDYPLDVVRIPVFSGIIEKEGFTFAHADVKVIRKAVAWADVVHVEDPFLVCRIAAIEARRAGKALTGTFHLYPENMTYAVGLGGFNLANRGFMHSFVAGVYNRCRFVQCPTSQVRDRLRCAGAKAELEVVSNGIAPEFIEAGRLRLEREGNAAGEALGTCAGVRSSAGGAGEAQVAEGLRREPGDARGGVALGFAGGFGHIGGSGNEAPSFDGVGGMAAGLAPLRVLSVGRLAVEKNQALLLEAVARARHGKEMRVVLAGKGPLEERLRRRAEDLGIAVDLGFREQDALRDLMCASDVYAHCADVEVEGMSCMEAFACGCVPLIGDAPLSSTKVFALTPHNLFRADDAGDLASRLDWMYENAGELRRLRSRYVEYAQTLSVRDCAAKVLDMMGRACAEAQAEQVRPGRRVRLSRDLGKTVRRLRRRSGREGRLDGRD